MAPVAEEIEETTRDFVIKRLAQELKGHPFAEMVAHLLGAMGYRCRLSPPGTDEGVDIIAHKDELGFEPPIIKVQVKSSESNVGDPAVSALYGKVGAAEFGLVVTLGAFTPQAKSFARSKKQPSPDRRGGARAAPSAALRPVRLAIQGPHPAETRVRPGIPRGGP